MPSALPVLAEDPDARLDVELLEDVRLGLPSDINHTHRARVCSAHLQRIEERLREAQCYDALQDLRNKLYALAHLHKYKKANVRHQGPNTRARADISKQEERRDYAAATYRRARRAKLALSGPGDWERTLRELRDDDIRHMTDDDPLHTAKRRKKDTPGVGEGHRTMSWIWRGADASSSEGATDSLRVEWIKARARSMRWEEETKLLPEEMRRCLATLQWEERQWRLRATARQVEDPRLQEGLVAYALDQAAIRRSMRRTFHAVCLPVARIVAAGSGEEWAVVDDIELTPTDLPEVNEEYRDIAQMYELDGEDLERPQWA